MSNDSLKFRERMNCRLFREMSVAILAGGLFLISSGIASAEASGADGRSPVSVSDNAYAKKEKVRGVVKDFEGQPLAGVNILVRKGNTGTTSDADGKFAIEVKVGDILEFSFIGFKTRTLRIKDFNPIRIRLEEDAEYLEDVVVVGYSTQRAQDVTGSISKVTSKSMERTSNTLIEQALNGRIAGVNTTSNDGSLGSGVSIRIRGGTSVNASNEPLWVIDGLPVETAMEGGNIIDGPSVSPLSNLDPGSIASIEVLKDASAAAIYGSRGANGVILITTKSGKAGRTALSYEGSVSMSRIPESRHIHLMNTEQYGRYFMESRLYAGGQYHPDVTFDGVIRDRNTGEKVRYEGIGPDELQALYANAPDTDWQKEFFRNGVISQHALSASGGKAGSVYSLRSSFLQHTGTMKNSYFKRFNFNLNMSNKLRDNLTLKTVIAPSYSTNKGSITGGSFALHNMGAIIKMLTRQPDRRVGDRGEDENEESGHWIDPISEAAKTPSVRNSFGLHSNLNLSYEVLRGLFASVSIGMNYQNSLKKAYYPKDFGRGRTQGGLGLRYHQMSANIVNQNMLMYKNNFRKHRISALCCFEQSWFTRESEDVRSMQFKNESLGFDCLQQGEVPVRPYTELQQKVMKSWLGRLDYGFAETFNLTVSFRADGSSVFKKNRWGYFPAAAVSWNMHHEPWMRKVPALSKLKWRASYGQTGNAGIPFYSSYSEYGDAFYVFGNKLAAGVGNSTLGDPDLKWEFTDQYDFGFELGLLKNRIDLTADLYYKKTNDMLLQMPIPISTGFSSRLVNAGNLENKGMELTLKTLNINKAFKWATEINFSLNRNKVLDIGGLAEQTFKDQFSEGQFTGILRTGESLGNWYGYRTDGIFTYEDFNETPEGGYEVRPEVMEHYGNFENSPHPIPGDVKYVDSNHDGKIDSNDRTIIARTQPKHMGSIYNDFSWKGLELGIFLTWKYGCDVINGNRHRLNATGGAGWNRTADLADALTPANPEGKAPRPDYAHDRNFTDRYVEDGSFLRLQSLNLSYTLPKKIVSRMKIDDLSVYVNMDNLHVWSKYSGYDPEVSVATGQGAITSANLDYGAYPKTTNFVFGMKIGF